MPLREDLKPVTTIGSKFLEVLLDSIKIRLGDLYNLSITSQSFTKSGLLPKKNRKFGLKSAKMFFGSILFRVKIWAKNIFGQTMFWPSKCLLEENKCGRKFFRPNKISAGTCCGRTKMLAGNVFWPEKKSANCQQNFRPKHLSSDTFFGRKIISPKTCSAKECFVHKKAS